MTEKAAAGKREGKVDGLDKYEWLTDAQKAEIALELSRQEGWTEEDWDRVDAEGV